MYDVSVHIYISMYACICIYIDCPLILRDIIQWKYTRICIRAFFSISNGLCKSKYLWCKSGFAAALQRILSYRPGFPEDLVYTSHVCWLNHHLQPFIYIYIYAYMSMYVCLSVFLSVCMYARTYVRTYVRMYVCMYVCLCVCVGVWVYRYVYIYICDVPVRHV